MTDDMPDKDAEVSGANVISDGTFVEIEYTGRVKDSGFVFDTTSAEAAKNNSIFDANARYGPVVVCIGEGQLLKGLEKGLTGKGTGDYHFTVSAEDGFGKKNAKLVQLVPASKFRENSIAPFPGLQVNVDGVFGIVKAVSGGRIMVDFNHPLSGKELDYDVSVRRLVTDSHEKLDSLLKFYFRDYSLSVSDGVAAISLPNELPQQLQEKVREGIKKVIPELGDVEFKTSGPTDAQTEQTQAAQAPQAEPAEPDSDSEGLGQEPQQ